jgi:putative methionine-R-sulfoxide reductase with GAF domain
MLFSEFDGFTADTEPLTFTMFNIKLLLFGLFLIASITVVFYINMISGKQKKPRVINGMQVPSETSLDSFSAAEPINSDAVMANLEVIRKLLSSNLTIIENLWKDYAVIGETERPGENAGEETLLKEISAQTEMMKQTNPLKLLYQLADASASLTSSKRISVFLFNPEKNNLSMVKGIGFQDLKERIEIGLDDGVAGFAFKNSKRIYVTNVETHPELGRKNKPQYKTKSFIIFPLRVFDDENVIGVLNITEKETDGGIYNMLDLEKMNLLMNSFRLKMENLIIASELLKGKK